MAWVVDTCVMLDVRINDPAFGVSSARCLSHYASDGLIICPTVFVELSVNFGGDAQAERAFFDAFAMQTEMEWSAQDTLAAHRLWHDFTLRRRSLHLPKRPIADLFIAGFAEKHQGVITRNVADFRNVAPALPVIDAALAITS